MHPLIGVFHLLQGWVLLQGPAKGGVEQEAAFLVALWPVVAGAPVTFQAPADAPALLMHQVMMVPTKLHEVVETRLTTVGPVVYVVPIDITRVRASRKSATPVPAP